MLDRLQIVKQRFDEISDLIIQPDVISDQKLCAIESRV
jgi:peptide chain release factor 1